MFASIQQKPLRLLAILAASVILAACTRSALQDQAVFLPPTLVGNSTPVILETFTPLPATATQPCENNLVFLRDVNVPDGTHFLAGQSFEKTWEVRNDGTCPWRRSYSLRLVDGVAMGALDRQSLPEVPPGEAAELTIEFQAPAQPGTYRSAWKAFDFGDNEFGVQIYVEIIVE